MRLLDYVQDESRYWDAHLALNAVDVSSGLCIEVVLLDEHFHLHAVRLVLEEEDLFVFGYDGVGFTSEVMRHPARVKVAWAWISAIIVCSVGSVSGALMEGYIRISQAVHEEAMVPGIRQGYHELYLRPQYLDRLLRVGVSELGYRELTPRNCMRNRRL